MDRSKLRCARWLVVLVGLLDPKAAAAAEAALEAGEAATLGEAIRGGRAAVLLRYRYEQVDDDAFEEGAGASTLRTVLRFSTLPYRGFGLVLEGEDIAAVVDDEGYANGGSPALANGVSGRPVVADPELIDLNQAFASFERGKTAARLGRQEILLGDERFVGNVGWRQNHQSFDAFTLTDRSLARVGLTYGYLGRVHRIQGDSRALAAHLANAAVDLGRAGKLTLYGYLLDYERPQDATLSTATLGGELAGERPLGSHTKLLYEVELARQRDYADNPVRVEADYAHLLLGGALRGITVKVGWELLEGSAEDGQFTTPLATLHKFNGWADKFLSTPRDGLEDLYFEAGGARGPFGWRAIWHDFSASAGGTGYGTELDAEVTWRAPWKQLVAFAAAIYDADGFAADTEKLWFYTTHEF